MDLLFCHRGILSTLMVHGRVSNALLAATLQMEENRLWSIKMKLDVSTALKSRGEKCFFWGICCCQLVWATCCNAGNGATLLLSSLAFVHVCVHQSKGRPGWIWERGTTGGNTARWWPEWGKHQVRAEWRDLYWWELLLQTSACSIYLRWNQFSKWNFNKFQQANDAILFSNITNKWEWMVSISKSSLS